MQNNFITTSQTKEDNTEIWQVFLLKKRMYATLLEIFK